MEIVQLNTIEDVLDAFNDVQTAFPVLSNKPELKDYLRKIHECGKAYAVRYDNCYCAFCGIYMNDNITRIAYITLIGVCEAYRKHRIGSKLIDYCENEAKKSGMNYVRLEVRKDNSAISFYLKNGYELEKQLTDSYYMIKKIID